MKNTYPKIFLRRNSISIFSLAFLLTGCGGINEEIIEALGNLSPTPAPIAGTEDPVTDDLPVDVDPIVDEDPNTGNDQIANADFNFQIIDSEKQLVTPLQDGDLLDMNVLPSFFNIEAIESSGSFLSVAMFATGSGYNIDRIEELPVWTLNSESKGFRGGAGTYTITAQGYPLDGADGELGGESSITITFQDQELSNQRPIAANDNAETAVNVILNNIDILINDSDPDNDPLTIISAEANFGSVSIVDNQLTYTPLTDYIGEITVNYAISDGNLIDSATLNIRIVRASTEIAVQWEKPDTLHNGTIFNDDDIAGYEILYRAVGDIAYQKVFVDDVNTLMIEVESLGMTDDVEFSIATVSSEGFYSSFSELITLDL